MVLQCSETWHRALAIEHPSHLSMAWIATLPVPYCRHEIKVKLIPPKCFVAVAFVLVLIGTRLLSHSRSHRYFTPNFTFAFAFLILKLNNSEIVLFRFALFFVSMVHESKEGKYHKHQ